MRWSRFLVITGAIFLFIGCNKRTDEEGVIAPAKHQKPLPKMEETFPFSEAEKIEILSYPVRDKWDTIEYQKGKFGVMDAVKDKKLQINPKGIKDRVVLNDKLKRKLFKEFFTEYEGCLEAACFNPRHIILFYNKESEIIAYMEICFECGVYVSSNNFKHESFCVETLWPIFKDAGIKYFGE